jgi:hypothetical protein
MTSGHLCSVGLRVELRTREAAKRERSYCTGVRFSHDINVEIHITTYTTRTGSVNKQDLTLGNRDVATVSKFQGKTYNFMAVRCNYTDD